MRNFLIKIVLCLFLTGLVPLWAIQTAYAAPGDFLFQWGRGHLLTMPVDVALDSDGNAYVVQDVPPKVIVLDKAGNFLRKWGSWGTGTGQLKSPSGVAVFGNLVYVADRGNHRIQVFDRNGNFVRTWGSSASGSVPFAYPQGITTDGSGNVYVTDGGNPRVHIFDGNGNFIRAFDSPGASSTGYPPSVVDVAVDANGNIYTAEPERIKVFDQAGKFLRSIETASTGYYASDLAVDPAGNLYLAAFMLDTWDQRLKVVDGTGNLLREWGSVGHNQGQFFGIMGLVLDDSRNVYAVDLYNGRVQVFDGNGNFLRKLAGVDANGQFNYPLTVATDSVGNVHVVDSENHRVQVFDSGGHFLRKFGSAGTADGQFDLAYGVAVDGAGNIYVSDVASSLSASSRIQVFDSGGRFIKKWFAPERPRGIAVAGNGNVYLTDLTTSQVTMYDNNGKFIKGWGGYGSANGQFKLPCGLAIDSSGNVHVTDQDNSRIEVFDGNGNFLRTWGGDGRLYRPQWIAFDRSGNTYVSDYETLTQARVQVFDSSGKLLGRWAGYKPSLWATPAAVAVGPSNAYVVDTANHRIRAYSGYGAPPGAVYSVAGSVRSGSSTGPVLAGATVSIASTKATSSSTGAYQLNGIPAGTYTLTIAKSGFATKTITGYVVNGNISGAVFYLSPQVATYSLSGTVRKFSNTGPILAGAVVSIAGKTATTSGTGTFSISGIPAGSYTVTISRSGYTTKKVTGYAISGNKSGVVFYLVAAPPFSLSGTVYIGSTSGQPLAGATVSIAGRSATTSSTGTFTVTGIPTGTYTLTISKPGYVTKTVTGYVMTSNKSGRVFCLSSSN